MRLHFPQMIAAAMTTLVVLSGCQAPPPVGPGPDHAAICDEQLVIFHPPSPQWQPIAQETMTVLRAGRQTAHDDFGLENPAMGLVLVSGGSGSYGRGVMAHHPDQDRQVEVFVMPIPDAGQLAAEIRNGNTMLAAGTPSLQAARHIAIFLQVHEMLHVLLETQLTPDAFHLWLNEGLAEYFAWRTAEVHAPDALPGFLDDRLSELSKLPPDGTIDFLAWSAADSEMLRRLALPDGEVITFGWSNGRRVNEIRRAADVARAAAGQFDGDRAEQLRRDAQLWDEWVQTVETAGGPGHLRLSSDDDRTRWGVYAGLLALFLEMDAAGLDPRSLIDSLRNTAYARLETRRDMDAAGEFHEINGLMLTATNDRILALLPDVDGVPAADLVRRYPVARARQVLEAQRSRLMAQARP